MIIKNITKKTVIATNATCCITMLSKAVGLMFSKPKSLIFVFKKEKIVPLHMLFVLFPIDVIFLDKNKTVVEIRENFRPFSFCNPKKKAMYVIEVPKSMAKKTRTAVGDRLQFWENS